MKKLLNAVFAALLITAPAFAQDASSPQMAQARAGTGETVVDSRGTIVGTLVDRDLTERFIDNQWVVFPLHAQGFLPSDVGTLFGSQVLFTSTDCSGQAYELVSGIPLRTQFFAASGTPDLNGYFSSGTLYFPGQPFSFMSVSSFKTTLAAGASCLQYSPPVPRVLVGPVKTFVLPAFVPPFTIR